MKTDEEYAAVVSALSEAVTLLGSALERQVHLYESEYDTDAPIVRPDWLAQALRYVELSRTPITENTEND